MYLPTPKNNQVISLAGLEKEGLSTAVYSPSIIRLNKPEQQDV